MFIATLTLAIHPGGTPDTKAWLKAAQNHLPVALKSRHLTLNVEIGQVNTLITIYALKDPTHDLCALRDGLATATAANPNSHSVTATLDLMQAGEEAWTILEDIGESHAPVLLQTFRHAPSACGLTQEPHVILHPLSGGLGNHWRLTRLENTDHALALTEATLLDDPCGVTRSCLLDPVR